MKQVFSFASQLLQQVGLKPTNILQPLRIKYVSTTFYSVNSIAEPIQNFEFIDTEFDKFEYESNRLDSIRPGTKQFAQP